MFSNWSSIPVSRKSNKKLPQEVALAISGGSIPGWTTTDIKNVDSETVNVQKHIKIHPKPRNVKMFLL